MAYPNLTHNNDNKAMKFTLHMIATSKCKFMYLKQDTGMAYSTSGQTLPSSPSGHPPTLLAANLRTSLPSGHLPPLLLAVNFTSPPGYIGVSREER